jgi:hypothetical protein
MGQEIDPVATALRAALEEAIADGRPVDAAALATELATRSRAVTAFNDVMSCTGSPSRVRR